MGRVRKGNYGGITATRESRNNKKRKKRTSYINFGEEYDLWISSDLKVHGSVVTKKDGLRSS